MEEVPQPPNENDAQNFFIELFTRTLQDNTLQHL
jgi:hypothetical protein